MEFGLRKSWKVLENSVLMSIRTLSTEPEAEVSTGCSFDVIYIMDEVISDFQTRHYH